MTTNQNRTIPKRECRERRTVLTMGIEELERKITDLEQRLEKVEAFIIAYHKGWQRIRADIADTERRQQAQLAKLEGQ
jgi:septal ring factor EnvC (AmiA/AmiB activator)